MDVALAIVTAIGTVAIGALGVWIRYQEAPDRRAHRIRRDLEILDALPGDSEAKDELRAHVEQSVSTMLEERKRSRNLSGAFFGLFTVAYGLYLYALGTSQGGWWRMLWALALLFVLAGSLGLIDGLKRGERDSEGLIIWHWRQRRAEARQAAASVEPDE